MHLSLNLDLDWVCVRHCQHRGQMARCKASMLARLWHPDSPITTVSCLVIIVEEPSPLHCKHGAFPSRRSASILDPGLLFEDTFYLWRMKRLWNFLQSCLCLQPDIPAARRLTSVCQPPVLSLYESLWGQTRFFYCEEQLCKPQELNIHIQERGFWIG